MVNEHISLSRSSFPSTLRQWVLFSTGSWALSSSIGTFIGNLISTTITNSIARPPATGSGDFHFGQGMFIFIVGLLISSVVSGLLIGSINGFFQAPFFRNYGILAWRWISVSVAVWIIVSMIDGWRLYFLTSERQYVYAFIAIFLNTALLTGMYWSFFRRHVPAAPQWAIGSITGYLVTNILALIQTIVFVSTLRL